jgi:hypothetical protein
LSADTAVVGDDSQQQQKQQNKQPPKKKKKKAHTNFAFAKQPQQQIFFPNSTPNTTQQILHTKFQIQKKHTHPPNAQRLPLPLQYIHTNVHTYTHTYTVIYIHTYIHITYIYTYVRTYVRIYMYIESGDREI